MVVEVEEDIAVVHLGVPQRHLPVQKLAVHAQSPRLVPAEAAADVDVLAERPASAHDLRIARDGHGARTFCHDIDRAGRRRRAAVRAVVGHADAVDGGVRSRGDVHARDHMRRRRRELRVKTRHTVEHHVIAVHIDAAHGEVAVHRRARARTDRRVVEEDVRERLTRIVIRLDHLLRHAHLRIRHGKDALRTKHTELRLLLHHAAGNTFSPPLDIHGIKLIGIDCARCMIVRLLCGRCRIPARTGIDRKRRKHERRQLLLIRHFPCSLP